LCALLLRLEQFRFRSESGVEPRLCCLLHGFRCIQRALSYHHFLPRGAELIKSVRHVKYDFLMRSIEADIRHHQLLPCGCPRRFSFTKVEQQPLRRQLAAR
jgi:hypothetical protein